MIFHERFIYFRKSIILERTLTGLKFETLFISSVVNRGNRCTFCIARKNFFGNTVIYNIHQWLRKHFSRYFHQFRRNFTRSCSIFVVYSSVYEWGFKSLNPDTLNPYFIPFSSKIIKFRMPRFVVFSGSPDLYILLCTKKVIL